MASSVFVTGANGYIGQAVAIALRNAGYRVYGLVRSADKGIIATDFRFQNFDHVFRKTPYQP